MVNLKCFFRGGLQCNSPNCFAEKITMEDNKIEKNQPESNKRVKPTPKSPSQKKREREDFRRKYFDYYDDVKTTIKQDW